MAKIKLTSGMWRIDPQKWSRVIDRSGQPVASVEADADSTANASLIAAAPDMFELLEVLENDASVSGKLCRKKFNWFFAAPAVILVWQFFPGTSPNNMRVQNPGLAEVYGRPVEASRRRSSPGVSELFVRQW